MPSIGEDEVLVKVLLAAICGTDLELALGYYDFDGVPGHEFVGEIASGPEKGLRVVADINIGCWTCVDCLNGQFHLPERSYWVSNPRRRVLGIYRTSQSGCGGTDIPDGRCIVEQSRPLYALLNPLRVGFLTVCSLLGLVVWGTLWRRCCVVLILRF